MNNKKGRMRFVCSIKEFAFSYKALCFPVYVYAICVFILYSTNVRWAYAAVYSPDINQYAPTCNILGYGGLGYNDEGNAYIVLDSAVLLGSTLPGGWYAVNNCFIPTSYWKKYLKGGYWPSLYKRDASSHPKNNGSTCSDVDVGNPINASTGNKYQQEIDIVSGSSVFLGFKRTYNSLDSLEHSDIGAGWRHSFSALISHVGGSVYASIVRPDGKVFAYKRVGDEWLALDSDIVGRLFSEVDVNGNIVSWRYTSRSGSEEEFGPNGKLLSITNRNGVAMHLNYDALGRLVRVVSDLSGEVVLTYGEDGYISSVADSLGQIVQYEYDGANLVSVFYPDNTHATYDDNPQRIYHYENSNFPHALTGITDENGNRYATWAYDSEGRAISSEHANGVDKTTLTYNADVTTTVTNPLGKQTTYHFTTIHGVRKVTQVEGHPTNSCEGANKSYSYDANGNIASKTDWNGVTTTYTYDMDRNLELTRTEAVGTPQERTITTEWHADFRLPTKITEPEKVTEYTYDAQGRQLSSKVSSAQ